MFNGEYVSSTGVDGQSTFTLKLQIDSPYGLNNLWHDARVYIGDKQ
jgi:hypothetical protein